MAHRPPRGPAVEGDPAATAEAGVAIELERSEDSGAAAGVSSLSPGPVGRLEGPQRSEPGEALTRARGE
eukprot:2745827-Alexandrium_andersonii.AAC.1